MTKSVNNYIQIYIPFFPFDFCLSRTSNIITYLSPLLVFPLPFFSLVFPCLVLALFSGLKPRGQILLSRVSSLALLQISQGKNRL